MKRLTKVLTDENKKDLHSGKFGEYNAHNFELILGKYDDHIILQVGKNVWASLNHPSKVKVTITVVE